MGRSSHFTRAGGGSLAAGIVPCGVVGVVQEAPRQTARSVNECARIVCLAIWLAPVFERAVSRALSYQRAAWMAMPTKTSATITIKAATMMSIVIAPSTTECGDQSADGGRGRQESRLPQQQQPPKAREG